MSLAARAIIIENNKILVMYRDKHGSQYYTLVGGRLNDGEAPELGVAREVREETGLEVTSCRLVYVERHDSPHSQQFIYLCQVTLHDNISIQDSSEEGFMNRLGANIHTPVWAELKSFDKLPFRTPQLQAAISAGLKRGFPSAPVEL